MIRLSCSFVPFPIPLFVPLLHGVARQQPVQWPQSLPTKEDFRLCICDQQPATGQQKKHLQLAAFLLGGWAC
jgi:hypothetical protein